MGFDALYAIAAHFAGDFPLQSDRMAAAKFEDARVRAEHVTVYVATFLPVVIATDWSRRQAVVFLGGLWGSHYAIDSRRWADPVEGFPTRPLWFDQAFHLIALAVLVAVVRTLAD